HSLGRLARGRALTLPARARGAGGRRGPRRARRLASGFLADRCFGGRLGRRLATATPSLRSGGLLSVLGRLRLWLLGRGAVRGLGLCACGRGLLLAPAPAAS